MDGGGEKRKFDFPKRQELVQQIKQLDDDIEHVSLNLIKCDFNATEKDVEKSFPEFNFVKVKNYNPGSFEVVFEMKIDAMEFIRNCFDRKILARRFFIKLGRQHKEVLEDWACVGHVPKKFQQAHHKNAPRNNRDRKQGGHQKVQNQQHDEKQEKQTTQHTTQKKETQKKTFANTQKRQQPNREKKQSEKTEKVQKQVKEEKQFAKKTFNVTIPDKKREPRNYDKKPAKVDSENPKTTTEQKPEQQNKQKKNRKQKEPKNKKVEEKKKAQNDEEEEGWITVPVKGKKK